MAAHRDELIALIRHHERSEAAEHPLNRILAIRDTATGLQVTTTDVHLPRRIGEALANHHHGTLSIHFDEGECFARVHWRSDGA